MAAVSIEQRLVDLMHELEEEYRDVLERRAANRRVLRDLLSQGVLSDEHAAQVQEYYPERAARGTASSTEA